MKQVTILSTLLGLALVGSYLTWTDEDAGKASDGAVTVYQAQASDLSRIAWVSDALEVTVERRNDDHGAFTWVEVTERTEKRPPRDANRADADADAGETDDAAPTDEGADAEAEATEPEAADPSGDADAGPELELPPYETVEEVTAFRGNQAAEELWEGFAPLMAMRLLDGADPTSAAFGLAEPDVTLEVARRSGPLSLVVGGETYGSKDRYVRYEDRVYLLDDAVLRPLQFGKSRLVERSLVPGASPDAARVEVTGPAGAVAFVHQNRSDRARAFWAPESTPDQADEAAGTWLDKLFRLRVQAYVSPDDAPSLEPVFGYAVTTDDRAWTVEVLRDDADEYYARSAWNRSLVRLTRSLAADVVADLGTVLAPAEADAAE